jgi:NitT/TauT family transport system ATP-binding protein
MAQDLSSARLHPLLQVEGVTLQYQTGQRWVRAAYRVSFNVQRSDRFVILGPSGCGKSTILKAVGGYVQPVEGQILLDGKVVHSPGPDRIFIFQEFDQLLPWKTVQENIVFALTAAGKRRRIDAIERARYFLQKVNLSKFANSYPHTLSGGMKQRAAIARALAMEPQMLLMDEPFAALDALTRMRMQEELIELCSETKATILFVTHSITEAIRVGNRILLMSAHPGQVKAELHSPGAAETDPASKALVSRIEEILFEPRADEGSVHA